MLRLLAGESFACRRQNYRAYKRRINGKAAIYNRRYVCKPIFYVYFLPRVVASDDIDENAATTNGEASIQDAADESRRLKDYRANFSTPTLKASEIEETRLLDELVRGGKSHRMLEQKLAPSEAVRVRRKYIERVGDVNMIGIPHASYDYKEVEWARFNSIFASMPLLRLTALAARI